MAVLREIYLQNIPRKRDTTVEEAIDSVHAPLFDLYEEQGLPIGDVLEGGGGKSVKNEKNVSIPVLCFLVARSLECVTFHTVLGVRLCRFQ